MAEVAPMDAALHAKIMRAWHGEDESSSLVLPPSGQISMGDIRTEVAASGQCSLNDAAFRGLIAPRNSGDQQAMSEYYGKSNAPPEVYIWKAGASGANCSGVIRGQADPYHEQVYGYMTYGGSSRISLDHPSGGGVHLWGNTLYTYGLWNGSGSEYPGGTTAQYSGRFNEDGNSSGGWARYPVDIPSPFNGTPLDSTKYGLEFKWHLYNREKVMGYGWTFQLSGTGGSVSCSKHQINQDGWTTVTMNLKDAKAGYYEAVSSQSYARGSYNLHLIHVKMVPEKVNDATTVFGQSRLEETLTEEEYRRYQVWLGHNPDAPPDLPAMTPEQWLAENPGQTLADPDAPVEFCGWSPES